MFPPTHFNELPPSSQGSNFPAPFLPCSSYQTQSGCSMTPFTFHGGALCIIPSHYHSQPREIGSLNSDDKHDQHVPVSLDHQHADTSTAQESNSPLVPYLSPVSFGTDQQLHHVVSTPPISTMDVTASSGSCQSTKRQGHTPTATAKL